MPTTLDTPELGAPLTAAEIEALFGPDTEARRVLYGHRIDHGRVRVRVERWIGGRWFTADVIRPDAEHDVERAATFTTWLVEEWLASPSTPETTR